MLNDRELDRNGLSRFATLLLVSVLAGCGALPGPDLQTTDAAPSAMERAADESARGDHAAAFRSWRRLAENESDPQRGAELWLKAADSALLAGKVKAARSALERSNLQSLTRIAGYRHSTVTSRLALIDERPYDAFELDPETTLNIDNELRARAWAIHAEANAATGDTVSAVAALVAREALLPGTEQIADNHNRIWAVLRQATPNAGLFQRFANADRVTRGWIELALLARSAGVSPDDMQASIAEWQQRYPGHPAVAEVSARMMGDGTSIPNMPSKVALLLPLTGAYGAPAAAIRDGYFAAWYASPGNRPVVDVYDTGDGENDLLRAYEQAVESGAGVIVGPLRKEATRMLTMLGEPAVPVLALNYLDEGETAPARIYQFGLSPEDEARQAAQRAALDGHFNAIALVPAGDWGNRTLAAFEAELRKVGGRLLSVETFERDARDFSKPMQRLLLLSESQSRYRALVNTIGTPVKFEPRRRQDVDFIFVAARADKGRLIRPQFRFFRADDVPIYATSRIFTGEANAALDQDMNGVRFCDVPWLLSNDPTIARQRAKVAQLWPASHERFARLYALGHDAYSLTPMVHAETVQAGFYYPAMTGSLFLRPDGDIGRALPWAIFEKGVPQPLDGSAETSAGDPS